jgi:hypothetical protein
MGRSSGPFLAPSIVFAPSPVVADHIGIADHPEKVFHVIEDELSKQEAFGLKDGFHQRRSFRRIPGVTAIYSPS